MNNLSRCLVLSVLLCIPGHAWATFPTVAGTASAGDATTVTTHTVNLPASIASGDLLLAFIACRNSSTTIVFPGGWTIVGSETDMGGAGSVYARAAVYSRTADGSEGATISVTTSISNSCASITKRITGQHTISAPESGTWATGDSTAPDPPSLTPSWGAGDTLWVAVIGSAAAASVSGYPTNYNTNQLRVATSSGTNAMTALAERELNATSDDPGTFTISSNVWGAQTVAIRPAAVQVFGGDATWFP